MHAKEEISMQAASLCGRELHKERQQNFSSEINEPTYKNRMCILFIHIREMSLNKQKHKEQNIKQKYFTYTYYNTYYAWPQSLPYVIHCDNAVKKTQVRNTILKQ